jgi:hypothetical protein
MRYCVILRKVIRKAKWRYYNNLITSLANKLKTTWTIIKNESEKACSTEQAPLLFKFNNRNINSAEAFNNYFLALIDTLNIQQTNTDSAILLLKNSFPNGFSEMINISVTEADIIHTITSLKSKSSTGYDGISDKILKTEWTTS